MTAQDSATRSPAISVRTGTFLAASAVVAFSLSFPATVWALDGFGPWTATGVRALLAGVIAAVCLYAARVPLPDRRHWAGLLTVAGGCVIGFPLLTTLALQTSTTAHSAVVIGILPLATVVISTLLAGSRKRAIAQTTRTASPRAAATPTRPSRLFWTAATLGALTVAAFTLQQSHGRPTVADLYLFGALIVCGAGYAEGGRLASAMPGWQVIAWAVVAALPVSVAVTALALPQEPIHLTTKAVIGMSYIAAISQFGAFVVWYRGMAAIGVPRASQLQLAQPLITLVWSVLLMGEHLPVLAPVAAVVVLACITVTQRTRT